ncbi:uncharacterized protein [Haliotis cracherodii]|uniref:uncharacterized protein n=1 Tax=Haliotis cracherodii TaxID=6455 RepID=UPI0039E93596
MSCRRGAPLQPHPDNCAWYFNCSMTPDAVMETFYNGFIMECPYPQLFSADTMQCEDFEDVECRGREEPKSPCDYRANHCHETSHCIPCWVRYASCLGQDDGLNAWPELEWKPFFVECYQERTVFQGICEKSAVFSPLTRACETPYSIPRQHGGWRPSCEGRRDNVYADEYGRCDVYYACKGEMFTGFFRCDSEQLFNPITKRCEDSEYVPYPCGNLDMPNVCKDRQDGLFLDAFGRCTHYLECTRNKLAGVSMCPNGIFNPEKRICDVSGDIVKPCGNKTNPCLRLEDGYHPSPDASCHSYIQCDRGFFVAKFQCENNLVYNEALKICDDVGSTSPPCGIAPPCNSKTDGLYPALNKGLQYFYECKNNAFITYRQCNLDQGGLLFSPKMTRCDLPASVCQDLYQAELKQRCF